jgi:eukaryotic-like serine/threonine-protein kinase
VPTQVQSSTGDARALALLDHLGDNLQALRIGDLLGEGGMGVVHEAEQLVLGRSVAVKTVKARSPSASLDLLREAWVTGSLEHPSIVPVHYLTVDASGTPSIVLKRIEGVEWSRVVADPIEVERRFGADDLLAWNLGILLQVLNAVRFAHHHGIIHRDLKPANVMIGDYGEVYLLDWGIAVSLRDDGTGRLPLARNATQLAGTPSYMAPEMLGREGSPPLSERTDVYLAGAVLYELITGHPPHRGTHALAVIASVIASRPDLPPGAPHELVRICERAMHEDPAHRFESIDALRTTIQRYLAHRGSTLLADRARDRLDELVAKLRVGAPRDEIYRLFGACRYGFRDALAVWADNERARQDLERAVVAVAEYELATDRPQSAMSLLAELDTPHALYDTARIAADRQVHHVEKAEQLRHQYDRRIGARTRMAIAAAFGGAFVIVPLIFANVPSLRRSSAASHVMFNSLVIAIVIAVMWYARASLSTTLVNRRLAGSFMFLYVSQAVIAIGVGIAGVDPEINYVTNLLMAFTISGFGAIVIDRWLWAVCGTYMVAFFVAAYDFELTLYASSVANAVFTGVAMWRWRPAQLERAESSPTV